MEQDAQVQFYFSKDFCELSITDMTIETLRLCQQNLT